MGNCCGNGDDDKNGINKGELRESLLSNSTTNQEMIKPKQGQEQEYIPPTMNEVRLSSKPLSRSASTVKTSPPPSLSMRSGPSVNSPISKSQSINNDPIERDLKQEVQTPPVKTAPSPTKVPPTVELTKVETRIRNDVKSDEKAIRSQIMEQFLNVIQTFLQKQRLLLEQEEQKQRRQLVCELCLSRIPFVVETEYPSRLSLEKMESGTYRFLSLKEIQERIQVQKQIGYTGTYINGKRHGQGTQVYINGDRYEGEWKDGNQHGYGIYYESCGDRYEGEWVNNQHQGKGVYYYANGDKYEGEYRRDCRHGQGKYISFDGSTVEGYWFNDGLVELPPKDEEEVDRNEPNAENNTDQNLTAERDIERELSDEQKLDEKTSPTPVFRIHEYESGDKYVGEWVNDMHHGKGQYIEANGDRYYGEWATNLRNGNGVYVYSNGQSYSGQFHDDSRHGWGLYSYPEGTYYEGEWKQDKSDGRGMLYISDTNETIESEWKDGEQVRDLIVTVIP